MEDLLAVPFAFDRRFVIEDKSILVEQVRKLLTETCGQGARVVSEATWKGQLPNEFERKFIEEHTPRPSSRAPERVTLVLENGRALTFMIALKRHEGLKIIGLSAGAP